MRASHDGATLRAVFSSEWILIPTELGACGVAWRADCLHGVQLPESSESRTRRAMRERFGTGERPAAPAWLRPTLRKIQALLGGRAVEFDLVKLDATGLSAFSQRVYARARRIPVGATASYGDLATWIGSPGAARAVGRALGKNPFPIVVPCHRVLAADGSLRGFSAPGGVTTKAKLLALEAATLGRTEVSFAS